MAKFSDWLDSVERELRDHEIGDVEIDMYLARIAYSDGMSPRKFVSEMLLDPEAIDPEIMDDISEVIGCERFSNIG